MIHHAGLYVIDRLPDGARLVNGKILDASGKEMSRNQVARANGGTSTQEIQKLLSFVPGRGYEEYQGDAGQLIKAGSYIDFYMHYTPNGQPTKDRSRLGLYFAKSGQRVGHQNLSLVQRRRSDARTSSRARGTRRSGAVKGSRAASICRTSRPTRRTSRS